MKLYALTSNVPATMPDSSELLRGGFRRQGKARRDPSHQDKPQRKRAIRRYAKRSLRGALNRALRTYFN